MKNLKGKKINLQVTETRKIRNSQDDCINKNAITQFLPIACSFFMGGGGIKMN